MMQGHKIEIAFIPLDYQMHSKNALTARLGFKAEEVLTTLPAAAAALATYFQKPIQAITKAPHGKKTDVVVQFADGTKTKIQNKNGDNQLYMLEINTHPGFTPTSIVPKIAKHLGISFAEIVQMLLNSASYD
jgi:D-alanine-D-alanine ligase-like ATP-grasp enzyme